MLIRNGKFAVCPITTHGNIKNISKKINVKKYYKKNYHN